jgi:hypothetical protein
MSFNLKTFLRRTSLEVLRQYFEARHLSLMERIDWQNPSLVRPESVFNAITQLSRSEHDAIIVDFEQVETLCDPVGRRALHSVAASNGNVLARLRFGDSDQARGIILLLEDSSLFDHAIAAAYADRKLHGRSWSGFSIDPAATIGPYHPNMPIFELELATALPRADGSMGKLKVDQFERNAVGPDGEATNVVTHYAIFREDLAVSDVEFQGDLLERATRRPVEAGAILYDADARALDVVTPGGRAARERIANSFSENVLCIRGKIHAVSPRSNMLDKLRQPLPFNTDPSDGIKAVKVTLLRLANLSARYSRITIEIDPSDRADICARSAEWFGDHDPLRRPEWRVMQAAFRVVFYPEPNQTRERVVTIELRAPNGSNLRDQTQRHQIISQKYLARWGLVA